MAGTKRPAAELAASKHREVATYEETLLTDDVTKDVVGHDVDADTDIYVLDQIYENIKTDGLIPPAGSSGRSPRHNSPPSVIYHQPFRLSSHGTFLILPNTLIKDSRRASRAGRPAQLPQPG